MQDELILEQVADEITNVELEETQVLIEEDEIEAQINYTQIPAAVEETELIEIDVSEGFSSNAALKVVADHSRYLPDQHTIGAITGLREELDELERLQTSYSDSKNQANYYLWEDENPEQQNRDGYFVAIRKEDNRIRVCSSDEDEFGVTVSSAGFIGGQEVVARNSAYGLVVHSGIVPVRCETDVEAGEYVVSDDYGVAQKTDGTYGYLVTAISVVDGIRYAIVSLTMPSTQMENFSKIARDVQYRMGVAEKNIAAAISAANAAYNKAKGAEDSVHNNNTMIGDQIGDIIDRVENMEGQVGEFGDALGSVSQDAARAYGIANAAATTAENIRREAVKTANEAQTSVNDLIADIAPVTTWVDPESGNKGAEYFVSHMNNNLATKTEVAAVEKLSENNMTAISQNADSIELLAMSIDKYSVGEWSQAYGLTWDQAKSILKKGMLYIPTVEHDEAYDGYPTDDNKHEFTRGYYYIWNGSYWVESEAPLVYFSSEYVYPSEQCEYWYRETNEDLEYIDEVTGDTIVYEANSLYVLIDDKWTKVNMLSGNITNRTTSMLIQTATEIAADVTNSRGWLAHMGVRITEDGSFADSIASTVSQTTYDIADGQVYASMDDIPGPMSGKYYAIGSVAPYDIYTWDGEKFNAEPLFYDGVYVMKPNTASIITAANKYGDTSIALNADRINFDGVVTFTYDDSGVTTIKGGGIRSGYIASNNFLQIGNVVQSGTLLDLNNGSIYTPNFQLDQYGNVNMAGRITATSGYIAGFTINHNGNWYYNGELVSNKYYYFVYDGINYYFKAPYNEILIFTTSTPEPMLTCGDFILEYDNRTSIPSGTTKITLTQGHSYIGYGQTSLKGDESGSAGVYVAPDGIGLGNGNFYVNNLGNVVMSGDITLDGNIKWGTNDLVCVLYSQNNTNLPEDIDDYEDADDDKTEWHKKYQADDIYVVYSYDGGNTWMETAIKIKGEDGEDGKDGSDGSNGRNGKDANLHEYGIFKTDESFVSSEIIYSPLLAGTFAVANKTTGTLTGYMGYATGSTVYKDEDNNNVQTDTSGVALSRYDNTITASSTDPYVIVTEHGAKMSYDGSSIYVCKNGAYVVQNGGTPQLIGGGSSGGTVVAVFG